MKSNKLLVVAILLLLFSKIQAQTSTDNRVLINLGENVNSKYVEINPHISADGKKLFYVREQHTGNKNFQDIWVSELGEDGKWKPAVRLAKPLNNIESNSVVSVNADGTKLLIRGYFKGGKLKGMGYSITRKTATGWSVPEGINIEGYADLDRGTHNNACLSDDGRVIIFSFSTEEEGKDNDLYLSFKKEDGSYSKPVKLAGNINTIGYTDFAPFLASDNKTLYFSSNRPGGLGETDIYKVERLDDTWLNWSEPANMGEKINGPGRESYYTLDAKGTHAYMVSDKNSIGLADIVMIELEEKHKPKTVVLVKGNIYDAKSKKNIEAKIIYHEFPTDSLHGETHSTPPNGEYSVTFPADKKFVVTVHAHGYVTGFDTISFKNINEYTEIKKDYHLTPIIKGEKVVLKHVNFETNKAILEPESHIELDKVSKFLSENEEVKILIAGHTDNVGIKENNIKLSEERAKAVMDYLLTKGIDANRIASKGYGDSQPLVPNTTDENKRQNRRVEFVITEE